MSIEVILIVVGCVILSILILIQVIFLAFGLSTGLTKKRSQYEEGQVAEDVIVQPKPVGYVEPSARKFEQCATPVFETSQAEATNLTEIPLNPVPVEHLRRASLDSAGHEKKVIPTIVVTSPTP